MKGEAHEREARTWQRYPADRRHLLVSTPSPRQCPPRLFVMQPFMLLALLLPVCLAGKSNLPPRFTSDPNGPGSEIVVVVKEGPESLGKEMLRVAGEDPDGDELTFGVQALPGSDLIRIANHVPSRNSAVVYLNKELDRETKDSYSLVLTLTDGKLGADKFVSTCATFSLPCLRLPTRLDAAMSRMSRCQLSSRGEQRLTAADP